MLRPKNRSTYSKGSQFSGKHAPNKQSCHRALLPDMQKHLQLDCTSLLASRLSITKDSSVGCPADHWAWTVGISRVLQVSNLGLILTHLYISVSADLIGLLQCTTYRREVSANCRLECSMYSMCNDISLLHPLQHFLWKLLLSYLSTTVQFTSYRRRIPS